MDTDSERAREEAASWLILLDDDPADADRQARFRAWLAAGPAHAEAWQSVSRTGNVLAMAPRDRNMSAVKRAPAWHVPAPLRSRQVMATLLAACLLLAVAPLLSARWHTDHATGTAQVETLTLGDGTTVRLGPDSALRLAFSSGERKVELLSGHALFDVISDTTRPFRVITRDATTTVLGTRFDVAIVGQATSVSVNRGHVEVRPPGKATAFDLRAGDWVRINNDGSAEKGSGLPDYLTAGPDARIAARNRPVAEVVDRIRPWFAGRIVLADGTVGRQSVTGVFDASDPARALELLVGPQGGRVTRVTPWLLIVSSGELF